MAEHMLQSMRDLLQAAKQASRQIAALDSAQKNTALMAMASALRVDAEKILAANAIDCAAASVNNVSSAMLDRLCLNTARIETMASALEALVALPDPVNVEREFAQRPNGLSIYKRRIPLGVIAMIYEARPNVTAEAGALCLKSGNACVLRGGSEAFHSNQAIAQILHEALRAQGLPAAAITVLPTTERSALLELLQQDDLVDLVIPRGGEGLIRFVADNSRIPVIKHYKGVCHLYVDKDADLTLALKLLIDGKCSRPAVCNALETLLVHQQIAGAFLPLACAKLHEQAVEIRGCEATRSIWPMSFPATEADYAAEFLDKIISVKVVEDADAALVHIGRFGSQHTEVIATQNTALAERFVRSVDASAVMVNVSSRFNDGGELGLGCEIGIATTKLHAYGPMGLESLTAEKFVVRGQGQVRHPDLL